MSAEALAITAAVLEGHSGVKKLYAHGVTSSDFMLYGPEFKWIENQLQWHRPLSVRIFRRKFPDFDWQEPTESIEDLAKDLKNERAFVMLRNEMEKIDADLEIGNAAEKATLLRDRLVDIVRMSADHQTLDLSDSKAHLDFQARKRALAQSGKSYGIPTGIQHIDQHWGGLVNGHFVTILARPGEGKTTLNNYFLWAARKRGYNAGVFSPELSQEEHECRMGTIMSADKDIQAELGLKHSFRNRALMMGIGYNRKSYERFRREIDNRYPSKVHLFNQRGMRKRWTPGMLAAKIEDLNLDILIVDPIYLLGTPDKMWGTQKVEWLTEELYMMAMQYDIPIIITNQAHRQGSNGGAPSKDASFNSDLPAQLAHEVIGLKHLSDENMLLCYCSKSRFGQPFNFEMMFYPNTGVLYETQPPTGNYLNGADDPSKVLDADMKELVEEVTETIGENPASKRKRKVAPSV